MGLMCKMSNKAKSKPETKSKHHNKKHKGFFGKCKDALLGIFTTKSSRGVKLEVKPVCKKSELKSKARTSKKHNDILKSYKDDGYRELGFSMMGNPPGCASRYMQT